MPSNRYRLRNDHRSCLPVDNATAYAYHVSPEEVEPILQAVPYSYLLITIPPGRIYLRERLRFTVCIIVFPVLPLFIGPLYLVHQRLQRILGVEDYQRELCTVEFVPNKQQKVKLGIPTHLNSGRWTRRHIYI